MERIFAGTRDDCISLSAACELRNDEATGRGLYARQAIPAGSLLLRERAYSIVIRAGAAAERLCHQCLKPLRGKYISFARD